MASPNLPRPNPVRTGLVLALGGLGLTACATAPARMDLASAPPSENRPLPPSAGDTGQGLHGTEKPYQIDGVWYYPHADPSYDVVGYASWYGQAFHNRRTADGEIFDQFGLSAAHKTLPLPSIVEVTNLDNGRSLKLRLNDRGPFVGDRVLDVSRAAAEQLGFRGQGLARVRVRYVGPAPAFSTPVMYARADETAPPPAPRRTAAPPAIIDAPLPTVPSRPSGQIQARALAPPQMSPATAVAPKPVELAAADASRFTEPSVALAPGQLTPVSAPMSAPSPGAPILSDPAPTRLAPPPAPVTVAAIDAVSAAPQALPGAPSVVEGYSVQAGAFSSRDNAERVAAQLGSAAAVRPLARGGLTLYRVILAGYPDAGAAEAARARAVAAGFADARVISSN